MLNPLKDYPSRTRVAMRQQVIVRQSESSPWIDLRITDDFAENERKEAAGGDGPRSRMGSATCLVTAPI